MSDDSILEHLVSAVIVLDAGDRVERMNSTAQSLLGISERRVLGQRLFDAAPGVSRGLAAALANARQQNASFTEREQSLKIGAVTMTVDCSVTPMSDGAVLVELVSLDRHLRISREHQLIMQNRAIRELIRGLAHEIKNPLGGLRGAAQLLERELDDANYREYTQVIISEADRMRRLVDCLLGPSGPAVRERMNLHEVLERVRHLAAAEAPPGVRILRDYDPSIPPFLGAREQLVAALLNIVRNASQAVSECGTISLRTRTRHRFTIGNVFHRLVACIEVIDDGPGIPADMIERIFYPMITSRAEGTGIGLPIAQDCIARHGGLIEATSAPGDTRFTVWLPLEADE